MGIVDSHGERYGTMGLSDALTDNIVDGTK